MSKYKGKKIMAIFSCNRFNCTKSINKAQCCYYCESKNRCEKKCNNNPNLCGELLVDDRVKNC